MISFDFLFQLCAGRPTRPTGQCWRGGGRAVGQVVKLDFRLLVLGARVPGVKVNFIFSNPSHNRCSTESQPGARWTAVDQLIGLLGGDEGSGDQNDREEEEEEEVEENEEEVEDEEGDDDVEESTLKERNERDSQYIDEDEEGEE